ncbi:multicopper oxidase domain-containing protein [Streptosporangium sp. NPDC005286]|uniref:multicopper oxidase domain-containing protein n=1 Tax=Streptosporangium sp. NPDC005286 TaxID=3154463 RepID=UPI0033B0C1FF
MVAEGEQIKVRILNRSLIDHPMHLHGHRVRVLSRNDTHATGSTWWTGSLNVAPGEIFEVDFTADNPGIWMDHCHNFKHGSEGMIMHLAYAGITSPFQEAHIPK